MDTPMPVVVEPGVYAELTADQYHADPCPEPSLSASVAKVLYDRTPLHAWAMSPRLNPLLAEDEETTNEAFEIGSAAHAALAGKGRNVAVLPFVDFRTKDAKAAKAEALASGCIVLTQPQFDRVALMVEAARVQLRSHAIGDVFVLNQTEVVHVAEVDGVWCRAMADCIVEGKRGGGVIYDFKTTAASAAPEAFTRTAVNMGYDVQAAHYLETVEAARGGRWRFRFIVQEKKDPWALSVVELAPGWLDTAKRKTARARALWRTCLDRFGDRPWPGYSAEIAVLDAPAWAEGRVYDREAVEETYRQQHGRDVLDAANAWQAPV